MNKPITTNITHCARCGEDHANLVFSPFSIPVIDDNDKEWFTHYAMCPTTNEPILMIVSSDEGESE